MRWTGSSLAGKLAYGVYLAIALSLLVAYGRLGFSWLRLYGLLAGFKGFLDLHLPLVSFLLFVTTALMAYFAFPALPLLYLSDGFLLGPFQGLLLGATANLLGSFLAFLFFQRAVPVALGRRLGGLPLRHKAILLVSLRLSPLFPCGLANYLAAALRVSPRLFGLTTLLGTAPVILLYTELGHQWLGGFATPGLQKGSGLGLGLLLLVVSLAVVILPARAIRSVTREGPELPPKPEGSGKA